MGRSSLLTLLTLSCIACRVQGPPAASEADPHGALACSECHRGGMADRELASVPSEACTSSGCHRDDIPGEVTLAAVRFHHRSHGSTESLALGCAGCHGHEAGGRPLRAGPGTCGLCHQDELSGERGQDCRLCHTDPSHDGVTSQGVRVPHDGLPWIEGGCLRCHFQVTTPVHVVSLDRCASCHLDLDALAQAGVGEDLHPRHSGVSCASCHDADNHRIEAMSSAVALVCSDCHADERHSAVLGTRLDPVCNDCHAEVHQAPQALLLGLASERSSAAPSRHFMDGITCRSCHQRPDGPAEEPVTGSGTACVGCHRAEYDTVLAWWQSGLADRVALVQEYVAGAERVVRGRESQDPAVRSTQAARRSVALVARGGGEHNLTLAHRLLEEAIGYAMEAYHDANTPAPTPPGLGRQPRQGMCAYCHYELKGIALTEQMDDALHREAMGGS